MKNILLILCLSVTFFLLINCYPNSEEQSAKVKNVDISKNILTIRDNQGTLVYTTDIYTLNFTYNVPNSCWSLKRVERTDGSRSYTYDIIIQNNQNSIFNCDDTMIELTVIDSINWYTSGINTFYFNDSTMVMEHFLEEPYITN